MNAPAAVLRRASAETPPAPLASELLAGWELAPGALLLLGVSETPLPDQGLVRCGRRREADRGPFRSVCWPIRWRRGSPDTMYAFAAACRLPAAAMARASGELLTLSAGREADAGLTVALLPASLGAADFAEVACRLAAAAPLPLARFLIDILAMPATASRPDVTAMLIGFLDAVADPDGFIEIIADLPQLGVFLQGWGRTETAAGVEEAVLIGRRLQRASVATARFARGDIAPPATGAILVLPPHAAACFGDGDTVERVYLLDDERLRCRRLVPLPARLDAAAVAPHLRPLLPSLNGDPTALDCLRAATRPLFQGVDTLNAEPRPIRLAVDVVALGPAGGAYLHGWLFDPLRLAQAVRLRCNGQTAAVRIDSRWTRILRPDVSDAFAALPDATPSGDEHGFAVHAPGFAPPAGGAAYLEIELADGGTAFMPLPPHHDADLRARLLRTADLYKPSGRTVIERQLAPFFLDLGHATPSAPLHIGGSAGSWQVAIVVPLAEPVLPRALLSQFLRDPLTDEEGLVLVCGPAWQDSQVERLVAELRFRGLPALLLRLASPVSAAAALDAAIAASEAEWLLLAGPQTHGREPGWRAALRAAAATHRAACLCPTLLYEDFSVRCTGVREVECLPHAPWFTALQAHAGLPAGLIGRDPPRPVLAGSLACCLVSREAVRAVAGAARPHAGAGAEALDFFFRLGRAGLACVWVPQAVLYAPDEPEPVTGGARVGRMVDDWCLQSRWGEHLATPTAERACAF